MERRLEKRKRNVNFTEAEVELLVELVHRRKQVIENKTTDSVMWKDKQAAWKEVENDFNSASLVVPRTIEQLKLKYKGLKKELRKKSARAKLEGRKTGGGQNDSLPLNTIDVKLMDMVDRRSVEGIPAEYDCDTIDDGETHIIEVTPITDDVLPTPIILYQEPPQNEDAGEGSQDVEEDSAVSQGAGTSRQTGWGVVAPVKLQQKKSTPLRSNKRRYQSTTAEATKVLLRKDKLLGLQETLTEQQIDMNGVRKRLLLLEEEKMKLEIELLRIKVKKTE